MFLALQRVGGQELQRDRPLQPEVLGLVDNPHPALAELFEDSVMGDRLANHGCPLAKRTLESGLRSIVTPGEWLRDRKSSGHGACSPSRSRDR